MTGDIHLAAGISDPCVESGDVPGTRARPQGLLEHLLLRAVVLVVAGVVSGSAFHLLVGGTLDAGRTERVVPEVSLHAAREAFDAGVVVFLDARSAWQYEKGHIAGAVNLPLYEFDDAASRVLTDVSRNAALITYCIGVTCDSAERLAERLLEAGYRRTSVFRYGWKVWQGAGYPANQGPRP